MAAEYHTIDLGRLALKAGEARRLELELADEEIELGGQLYAVSHRAPARLDVSRTLSGFALRLRYAGRLDGPCMRCLMAAHVDATIDSREVDQPASEDEELRSPYVEETMLDLGAWAHDALLLALPQALLCRPDCMGLCPVCGVALNEAGAEHRHDNEPDPRWAKLRELKLD